MVAFLCGEFRGEGAESVLEMQRGFAQQPLIVFRALLDRLIGQVKS